MSKRIPPENRVQPLSYEPIAGPDGKATNFMAIQWQRLVNLVFSIIELQDESASNAARITQIEDTEVIAGTGLSGGGRIGGGDITLDADIQALLDVIATNQGSILYRGASGWQALAPGTADFVLATKGTGADPEWVAQTGGGGGGEWGVIDDFTITTPIAERDVGGLADYSELMFIISGVTTSVSGQRGIRFSVNNGASYFSGAGDYATIPADGTTNSASMWALHSTNAALARSASAHLVGNVAGVPKFSGSYNRGLGFIFSASTDVITNVRFVNNAGGNLTGGRLIVLGR